MSARQFGYYDNWKSAILRCERCGWTGTFEQGSVGYYDELMDCSCPACDAGSAPMLAIVSYPTMKESEANLKKLSTDEKRQLSGRKRFLAAFDATSLKSEKELPEIDGLSITLTWDQLTKGAVELTVIKHGEKEIWRERTCYEGSERFKEMVDILKKKYGSRLIDVVPTRQSELYLYGDDIGSIDFVKSVRADIKKP